MRMKKTAVFLLCVLATLLLTACNKEQTGDVALKQSDSNQNAVATTSISEDLSDEDLENGEVHWLDEKEDYNVAVRVTINPDAVLYLKETEVVGVNFLNEDAKTVYSTNWMLGRSYRDVISDMFKGANQCGFVKEDTQIMVQIIDNKNSDYPTEFVYDGPIEVLKAMEEFPESTSIIVDGKTAEEWEEYKVSEEYISSHPNVTNGNDGPDFQQNADEQTHYTTCTNCNGSGNVPCTACGGTGQMITIVEHEELRRNDFVCPTCGGKGWIDDGMHGGKTAECGYCTTNGGSGDFRERAYDVVIVEEEVPVQCTKCGGTGKEACPVCGGAGGY